MTRTILVTGARGKTGREVVAQLRDRPEVAIRAGTSRLGENADTAGFPVTPVRFDWHDPATWSAAVDGMDAIYLMRPDIPEAPERVAGLVDLNPGAHVVLLSEQGAADLPPDHWVSRVEKAVITRTSAWTLLRPSWFHQILTDPRFYRDAIRDDRVLSLPSSGAPLAWVDARDIAAVAVAVLRAPADHDGRAHTITGPEALPVAVVAEELSNRLGHPIRVADPLVDEVVRGLDPWTTGILEDLYRRVRQRGFAALSPAVEEITGRSPRSIRRFIDAHLEVWRDGTLGDG